MLTDIVIKALELLPNAIRGAKIPQRQRRRIAKQLLKIHINIDNIVKRAEDILSLLSGYPTPKCVKTVKARVALQKLKIQQAALENLLHDLNDEAIMPLLRLHVPRSGRLSTVADMKRILCGFFIDRTESWFEEKINNKTVYTGISQIEKPTGASHRPGQIFIFNRNAVCEAKWKI